MVTAVVAYAGHCASVNEWLAPRKGGGLRHTGAYAAFLDGLILHFRAWHAGKPAITGSVEVRIWARVPPRMDLANITKPMFDALERAAVIADDRQISSYSMSREPIAAPAGRCAIMLNLERVEPVIDHSHRFAGFGGDYDAWMPESRIRSQT